MNAQFHKHRVSYGSPVNYKLLRTARQLTPVATRQEVTEEQKICMRDFTIRTFHLLLLLTNKCTMHSTHNFNISTYYYYSDNTQATGGHN